MYLGCISSPLLNAFLKMYFLWRYSHTIISTLLQCIAKGSMVYSHRCAAITTLHFQTIVIFLKETLCPLAITLHFLSPSTWQLYSLSLWLCLFWTFLICEITHYMTVWPGCFHSAQCFQGSARPWYMLVLHSFLWLTDIPFCGLS